MASGKGRSARKRRGFAGRAARGGGAEVGTTEAYPRIEAAGTDDAPAESADGGGAATGSRGAADAGTHGPTTAASAAPSAEAGEPDVLADVSATPAPSMPASAPASADPASDAGAGATERDSAAAREAELGVASAVRYVYAGGKSVGALHGTAAATDATDDEAGGMGAGQAGAAGAGRGRGIAAVLGARGIDASLRASAGARGNVRAGGVAAPSAQASSPDAQARQGASRVARADAQGATGARAASSGPRTAAEGRGDAAAVVPTRAGQPTNAPSSKKSAPAAEPTTRARNATAAQPEAGATSTAHAAGSPRSRGSNLSARIPRADVPSGAGDDAQGRADGQRGQATGTSKTPKGGNPAPQRGRRLDQTVAAGTGEAGHAGGQREEPDVGRVPLVAPAAPATDDGSEAPARRRRLSPLRVISTLLIVVGIGLLVAAGVMWGSAQWRYHEQAVINDKLAHYAEVGDSADQAPKVDWAGLKAINDEVVAWLQIPGTTINYPVYQGSDNVRYLRHNAEGDWTVGGQLFIDYECTAPGMVDGQTIVYGHHLDDGSMFEQVAALDNQASFDATSTVWYVTEECAWELEPLFMYFTQAEDTNARRFQFASVEDLRTYLRDLLDRSVTRRPDAAQVIAGTSHVLTLSTCNYYDGYGRSLLVCVPKDEAREARAATQ